MEDEEKGKKMELIHEAIKQLLDDRKKKKKKFGGEEEDDILLSKLLFQLDSLEKDAHATCMPKCPLEKDEPSSSSTIGTAECGAKEAVLDEVVRELKKVKRQNLITHCLLSVMIVVTAVWQFSEAWLLLSMKQKVTHPIKSVGDMITGALKGQGKKPKIDSQGLPPVSVPELPHIDLPSLSLNGNQED